MPWQIQFARTSGSGLQVDQPPLPLRKHAARPLVQPPVFEHIGHRARPAHLSRAGTFWDRKGGVGGKETGKDTNDEGAKEKSILVFLEEREGRGCSTRRGGSGSCRHWRPRSFRIPRCVELCECARACMFQCARARVENVTAGTSRWLTSLQPAGIPSTRVHPGGSTAPATG